MACLLLPLRMLRLLYKVRGPQSCHFPLTPELAAELDALTVQQVLQQLRCAWRRFTCRVALDSR